MDNRYSGGMLGNLFNQGNQAVAAEDKANDGSLERLSAMDGFQADRLASYQGSDMLGTGIGQVAAAVAGKDPRTPAVRNQQAIEAAKAQVSQIGFDPSDPKSMDAFYKQVIAILQKQGLVAEAMAVAHEWNGQKQADAKANLSNEELQRKKDRDLMNYDAALARVEALKKKGFGAAASPIGKMMSDMENSTDPVMRAHLQKAIENAAAGKVIVQDLGDRIQLLDPATREVIRTDDKGLAPLQDKKATDSKEKSAFAYQEIKADMQRQVDKAAELHNHVGLEGMTGRLGRLVGQEGTAGQIATTAANANTRAAHALYVSIVGGTLLTGLSKLKRESPSGASGLGALSEREGAKVQADAAALDQYQNAADMRLRLRQYISNIMSGAARLDAKAQGEGVPVVPTNMPQLTAPGNGRTQRSRATDAPAAVAAPVAAPQAAPVAAPAAAPTAGSGWTPEKENRLKELQLKHGTP